MKIKSILIYAGYVLAFFISLYIFVYLTLPDERIAKFFVDRYTAIYGVNITYRSAGITPSMNILLKEVELMITDIPQKIKLDRVEAGISLSGYLFGTKPLILKAEISGGSIRINAGAKKEKIYLSLNVSDLDIMKVDFIKDKTGLNIKGQLNLQLDIKYDQKESKNNSGSISIEIKGSEIKGGKVMGFEIPSVNTGDIKGEIDIKEGKFKVSNFKSKGKDVELRLSGEGGFLSPPSRGNLNLSLRVRPSQGFIDREEKLKTVLFGIGSSLDKEGFYNFSIKGTLSNPAFNIEKK